MKVKIKDLRPNPFRKMDEYPLNYEKIEHLKSSINELDFWDNLVARNNKTETNPNEEIQIAYGHHRLLALHEIYGEESEETIDISVRSLPDKKMLKIMAEENNEYFLDDIRVIDLTIGSIGSWLAEHPEEARGQLHKPKDCSHGNNLFLIKHGPKKGCIIGRINIGNFLPKGNWSDRKISESLKRQKRYEKDLDKESMQRMPTCRSAETFEQVTRKNEVSKQDQKEIVKELERRHPEDKQQGTRRNGYSVADIKNVVMDTIKDKKKKEEIKIDTFTQDIQKLRKNMQAVSSGLEKLIEQKDEFTKEAYLQNVSVERLILAFDNLISKIKKVRDAYLPKEVNKQLEE